MNISGQLDRKTKHYLFYRESIKKYSPFSVKALRWNCKESQLARFYSLLRVGSFENKSVLDVGAGTGDLFFFLKEKGFNNFFYTGIEILNEFFNVAKERLKSCKNVEVINGDFFEYQFKKRYDITICNGSLNLREEDNYILLSNFLKKSMEITRESIGITLLKEAEGYIVDKNLFHYSEKMVDSLLENMKIKIKNYKIFSDYIDNDFTVIIWL